MLQSHELKRQQRCPCSNNSDTYTLTTQFNFSSCYTLQLMTEVDVSWYCIRIKIVAIRTVWLMHVASSVQLNFVSIVASQRALRS